jgi:AraC-like DNA-binding protein
MVFTASELLIIPAIALTALQGIYFAIFHTGRIALLLSSLFILLVAFLLLNLNSIFNYPPLAFFVFMRMAILIPAVLWLLTFNLFSDEGEPGWQFWVICVVYFLLESVGTGLELWSDIDPESEPLLNISVIMIPQLVMIGFAIHSIYLALHGYYSDLIQTRRYARVVFVVCMAILVLLVLGNGILISLGNLLLGQEAGTQGVFPDILIAAYILFLMFAFHLCTYTLRGDVDLLVSLPVETEEAVESQQSSEHDQSVEKELAARIVDVMQTQKLYREEKYTITQFAHDIGIPEHRLRKIINKQMKHRNFNQFLNGFRISEAAESLANSDTPISSIAYEVGFSTLSVFNRAFKEKTGTTPKEYRNSH